jgi:hypothetical protein
MPLAQSILGNPGGLRIWQFGFARGRLAHCIEPIAPALDHELESAKVAPVFERQFIGRGQFQKHGVPLKAIS